MSLRRLMRVAPFTTIVLASWWCMLLGGMLGWTVHDRFGSVWQLAIMPAYSVFMVATILTHSLGRWASLPVAVALVVMVDGGFALLRRIFDESGRGGPGGA